MAFRLLHHDLFAVLDDEALVAVGYLQASEVILSAISLLHLDVLNSGGAATNNLQQSNNGTGVAVSAQIERVGIGFQRVGLYGGVSV